MRQKILFDTCTWIDFLRNKEGLIGDFLASAIEKDQAVLCGVIITELLQGAKGRKEQQQLNFIFENIESLRIEESNWLDAGETLQSLRTKGITLPLTDALIASVSKKHKVPIFTMDKYFQYLDVELIND